MNERQIYGEPERGACDDDTSIKVPTDKEADGDLIRQIRRAVAEGRLKEPFRAADVCRARVRCAAATPGTFLSKHRVGNGRTTELFVRVGR